MTIYRSICLSLSLFCLCPCLLFSVSLCLWMSVPLAVSLSVSVSLCLCHCLCLSLPLPLSVYICLCLWLSLSQSASACLCLYSSGTVNSLISEKRLIVSSARNLYTIRPLNMFLMCSFLSFTRVYSEDQTRPLLLLPLHLQRQTVHLVH